MTKVIKRAALKVPGKAVGVVDEDDLDCPLGVAGASPVGGGPCGML
jgi:hypothetical protein